jgi:DNA-binding LytR/AlgR family response regulator
MRRHKRNNLTQLISKSKRGQLISVSVQENYVSVTTSAGTDLLRMSLAAAMKLIEPGIGLQVHRSHWVAISAIKSVNEQNRTIHLVNKEEIPVSTTFMPNLTLELSRKDNYSQLSALFERDVTKSRVLNKLSSQHVDARKNLDRMFLEVYQGKSIDERLRVRIAYQIFRLSTTDFTYLAVQLVLFCGLAFLGTYGLFDLTWYQPPLFWALGYALCFFVTVVAHVFVWYMDLKYGSNGWFGPLLLTLAEATSSVTVLYLLSLVLFGPIMVPYLVFLISSYFLHSFYAPIVHMIVREHQSFSSWKTALNVPPIVLQLPFELRGELVSISANGRAVDVTTTTGSSTIKKKFSDAITMIGDRKGIQVHRSHWVASDYVQGRSIKGGLNFVEMKTGEYVPLAAANTVKLDAHLNRYG